MTRRMADSVTPANLPAGFDLYGGYDDGSYNNVAAIKARFPSKLVLAFTVFAHDNFGDCLDVEKGDATPTQAPGWVHMRRIAGHGGPLVYCSWSDWPTVKAAFDTQHITYPGFIVAGYPAPDGDAIPAGCVGHQWIDRGPYDESIIVDYLPGIDPPHPTPSINGADMIASTPTGNGYWIVTPHDGAIYSYGDAKWLGALNYPKNVLNANAAVTGFASHPTQEGYWISTSDNAVYAFGAATYHGAPNATK